MSNDIRQHFLNYFRKRDHKFLRPSKVFLDEDPTLMFVNAGMNQLKATFLGEEPVNPNYSQLMNAQICIRTGGKHNDFEEVGSDPYHLTSFEMLGSWSLDKYSKREAISLAYHYLVDECQLNPDRLYVTYFEGDGALPEDSETRDIWLEFLPARKILKGSFRDNFWMMDFEGPCGMSTEIHYDLIGDRDASQLVNTGDSEVIEIWNLVFVTYQKTNGEYRHLDRLFVDTGMGLERLSMIRMGRPSVFTTPAFNYIIGYAQAMSNSAPYGDCYRGSPVDRAYRIFSDHLRTTIIALHQQVEFDDTGRGFVLRKVFRRGLAHFFVHLNGGSVEAVMNRSIVASLIDDVLNYFLEKNHDTESIQKKLIREESLSINNWRNIKVFHPKYMKRLKDPELVRQTMKSRFGIDSIFLENIDRLKFKFA
jgi:alanyl-tRNA synthetase